MRIPYNHKENGGIEQSSVHSVSMLVEDVKQHFEMFSD